jgi:uncharacterized membrane protein
VQRTTGALAVTALLILALTAFALAPLALPASYSWFELGLSEAAAQGVEGAWVARTGFLVFGFAVIGLVRTRHATWTLAESVFHGGFGLSMIGVATFAHRPWDDSAAFVASEDVLHSVFATIAGIGFIGGVVVAALTRTHRAARTVLPDMTAIIIAVAVPLMMSSSAWGVLQRLMFLTAACWYAREAHLSIDGCGQGLVMVNDPMRILEANHCAVEKLLGPLGETDDGPERQQLLDELTPKPHRPHGSRRDDPLSGVEARSRRRGRGRGWD